MSEKWAVYVNGEKVAEFDDPGIAEGYMNQLAAAPEDPTDSFDVVEEHD